MIGQAVFVLPRMGKVERGVKEETKEERRGRVEQRRQDHFVSSVSPFFSPSFGCVLWPLGPADQGGRILVSIPARKTHVFLLPLFLGRYHRTSTPSFSSSSPLLRLLVSQPALSSLLVYSRGSDSKEEEEDGLLVAWLVDGLSVFAKEKEREATIRTCCVVGRSERKERQRERETKKFSPSNSITEAARDGRERKFHGKK